MGQKIRSGDDGGDGQGRSWAELITDYNHPYRNGDASMNYDGGHDSDDLLYCTKCENVYSAIGDAYNQNYRTEIYPEYFLSIGLPDVDCPRCDPDRWVYGKKRTIIKNGNV